MMKHDSQRDEDAKHVHDKKLSRAPVTIDSVCDTPDDGYKARYEQAMVLLRDILSLRDRPLVSKRNIMDFAQMQYDELRDSE